MTRLVGWIVSAVVVLTGCSGSGARTVLDPFSRTTVEPPRTGCIMGQPADPYYSGTRRAAVPNPTTPSSATSGSWSPGSTTAPSGPATRPSGTTPKTSSRYGASAGSPSNRAALAEKQSSLPATGPGDRVTIPLAARDAVRSSTAQGFGRGAGDFDLAKDQVEAPASLVAAASRAVASAGALVPRRDRTPRSSAGDAATAEPATRQRVVATIQPGRRASAGAPDGRPAPNAPAATRDKPSRLAMPPGPIDIMDLPARSTGNVRSAVGSGSGAVRLVSASEEVKRRSAGNLSNGPSSSPSSRQGSRDSFSPRAHFGYDPDYRWLRGRLEYSDVDRRWKLRYIPIDGTTDEFGGSVALPDASPLSGYERGQFVEIHGTLGRTPEDNDRGYAPEYQIHEIKPLGT